MPIRTRAVLRRKGTTKYLIVIQKDNANARLVYESLGGTLDTYTQPFTKLDVDYDEVFYTYKI